MTIWIKDPITTGHHWPPYATICHHGPPWAIMGHHGIRVSSSLGSHPRHRVWRADPPSTQAAPAWYWPWFSSASVFWAEAVGSKPHWWFTLVDGWCSMFNWWFVVIVSFFNCYYCCSWMAHGGELIDVNWWLVGVWYSSGMFRPWMMGLRNLQSCRLCWTQRRSRATNVFKWVHDIAWPHMTTINHCREQIPRMLLPPVAILAIMFHGESIQRNRVDAYFPNTAANGSASLISFVIFEMAGLQWRMVMPYKICKLQVCN